MKTAKTSQPKTASRFFKLGAIAAIALSGLVPAKAENVVAPKFFGAQERFERPNLTGLSRLRFLTTVDFPPFNFIDRTGHLSGYNIDLVRAICLELKVQNNCQIEAVPWDELTTRLEKNEAEAIIAGLAPTAENREKLIFSRAYMRFPARFIGFHDSKLQEPFGAQLDDVKVGVVKNTAHQKMLAAYFPTAKPVFYDDYDKLFQAVKDKDVTLAFGDGMRFSLWLGIPENSKNCQFVGKSYPGPDYLGEGMRIAVNQKHANLVRAIDYAMQSLEQKGKLTELYLRYFPVGFY